ncbi:major facilitator superfamily multidrug-resistance, DHA1 sub-family [Lentinula detonsa]|uniref:Major facilitator superfamily multidrug-resistance, DHA1 sub-family n=1 Tax=Lentinula detonsa TaxID=2804962 RepID=A0AA38UQ71_9AGAR|nr:major facilitator superfamily multidrug-resistance, DHA1 sub-family [Lentinula detonsa]
MSCPPTTSDDETQPLLRHDAENSPGSTRLHRYSLYLSQLAVLCFLRMLDPLNFTQIFPYINEFVSKMHLTEDSSQIGFYSGKQRPIFALCQLIAIYPWSSLSDRTGRRPVIIAGTLGLTFSTILFGVSQSFLAAMIARALAGLFSGNVPIIPTVLCEITDPESESVVFPFFGIFWPLGMILGPLIGGSLSNIAHKYPMFFDYLFLKTYPYFLPCLVIAAINFAGVCFAYFFLREVRLSSFMMSNVRFTFADVVGIQTRTPAKLVNFADAKTLSMKELLSNRMIHCLCTSACFLSFVSTAFDVIFVLFCYTPILKGGLGLETSQIGYALAISGLSAAFFQLVLMPTLLRRVDHAKCYHFTIAVWPVVFLILPGLNIFARNSLTGNNENLDDDATAMLWIGIGVVLVFAKIGFLPYTINTLLVKRYGPSASSLGASNGLLQFFICLSRSFSPFVSSSVFVVSAENNLFMGYGWAILLSVISLGSTHFSGCILAESKRLHTLS